MTCADRGNLSPSKPNPASASLDQLSVLELVQLFAKEPPTAAGGGGGRPLSWPPPSRHRRSP